MKTKTFYRLVKTDRHGVKRPVMISPNNSLEPFAKKGDAKEWAEDNPSHFSDGTYAIDEVFQLVPQEEEATAPANE